MARQFLSIWIRSWYILRHKYDKFSTDPQVQYNYHRRMILFWMGNFIPMNVIVGLSIWASLTGHDGLSVLLAAVLLGINTNYSLYANWDTEVGDAHGAYASIKTEEIQAEQLKRKLPPEVQW